MTLKKLLVTSCLIGGILAIPTNTWAMEKDPSEDSEERSLKGKEEKKKKSEKKIIKSQLQSSIIKEVTGENYDKNFVIMVLGEKKANKLFSENMFSLDRLEATGKILKELGKEAKLLGKLWNKVKSLPLEIQSTLFKELQEKYMEVKKKGKKKEKKEKKKALKQFYQEAMEKTNIAIEYSTKSLSSTIAIKTEENQKLEKMPTHQIKNKKKHNVEENEVNREKDKELEEVIKLSRLSYKQEQLKRKEEEKRKKESTLTSSTNNLDSFTSLNFHRNDEEIIFKPIEKQPKIEEFNEKAYEYKNEGWSKPVSFEKAETFTFSKSFPYTSIKNNTNDEIKVDVHYLYGQWNDPYPTSGHSGQIILPKKTIIFFVPPQCAYYSIESIEETTSGAKEKMTKEWISDMQQRGIHAERNPLLHIVYTTEKEAIRYGKMAIVKLSKKEK